MTTPDSVIYARALRMAFSEEAMTRAQKAQNRYRSFCQRLGVSPEAGTARVLYLTWLVDSERRTGKQIDRLLTDLDVAAQLEGWQRWRESAEVVAFLPGLFREHGLGPCGERADPLYRELVAALVEAVMTPSLPQLRDQAAVLLVHDTPLERTDLPYLLWRHIHLRRDSVNVVAPPRSRTGPRRWADVTVAARRGPLCVVATLRRLREHGAAPNDQVLPPQVDACKTHYNRRAATAVTQLDTRAGDLANLVRELGESPRQCRDRAILLIAYGAGLVDHDTIDLRQRDVTVSPEGLVIDVPDRPGLTRIPADPGMPNDAVAAWESWASILRQQGRADPDERAFLSIWKRTISGRPICREGLNEVVHQAVNAAGFTTGYYSYTSLRWGLIRTAFRTDEPLHLVAQHVGLKSLSRVAAHHRREHIIRRSVAGQLGL